MRRVLVTFSSLFCLFAACAPEGPSAYVSVALPVPQNCKVTPDADTYLAVGQFDIANGADFAGARKNDACQNSYYLHLLVNSNLKSNANEATGRSRCATGDAARRERALHPAKILPSNPSD